MQETQVLSLSREGPLEDEMAAPPVFLSAKSHGRRSLGGYSPRGRQESDVTWWLKNSKQHWEAQGPSDAHNSLRAIPTAAPTAEDAEAEQLPQGPTAPGRPGQGSKPVTQCPAACCFSQRKSATWRGSQPFAKSLCPSGNTQLWHHWTHLLSEKLSEWGCQKCKSVAPDYEKPFSTTSQFLLKRSPPILSLASEWY